MRRIRRGAGIILCVMMMTTGCGQPAAQLEGALPPQEEAVEVATETPTPTPTVEVVVETVDPTEEPTETPTPTPTPEEVIETASLPTLDSNMRGVWVATLRNIDYPNTATTNSESLKAEADNIIANCAAMGINNIFLQVRPTSDAFYKSNIYPWSKYCTGAQGVAPDNDFDPLTYWIKQCHNNGIKLHAWINPYRVTRDNDAFDTEYVNLPASNPAKQHPEWLVRHKDNYYFNPAIPEVRQLVTDGVMEIVNNYDIDGIHFDDYFYPNESGEAFNDDASFIAYNNGFSNKADWRRNNVNLLVQSLNPAIKAAKPNVAFGISPCGIWANKKNNPAGSDTNGMEAYNQLFADTRMWAQSEWIDYIAPQLYWTIGYSKADYAILANWLSNQVAGSSTRLYIGLADYRTFETDASSDWYQDKGVNMIAREMEINATSSEIDGEIHYNYSSLSGNQALRNYVTGVYKN